MDYGKVDKPFFTEEQITKIQKEQLEQGWVRCPKCGNMVWPAFQNAHNGCCPKQ